MSKWAVWLPILLLIWAGGVVHAVELVETTAHQRVILHAGPSHTYSPVDVLDSSLPVQIVERNDIGNWVRVERHDLRGNIVQNGWLMLGYLDIPAELKFSRIPATDLPAADLDNIGSRSMRLLYEAPVVPALGQQMQTVYDKGKRMGRDSQVITKVGDSLSADYVYLAAMAERERSLGPYDYLAPTVDYYGASTAQASLAAQVGLSSVVVLDPFWADLSLCEPNETLLECEYRRKNPAVALIMFGPNDVIGMGHEQYGQNMRRITERTMELGVIPVLSTFSYSPDHELWQKSVDFNLQLVEIADEYQVPLINLWAASRPLESYGLARDFVHMKQSGFPYLKLDSGHETFYGSTLRNLLAIRTLHEIRTTLELE